MSTIPEISELKAEFRSVGLHASAEVGLRARWLTDSQSTYSRYRPVDADSHELNSIGQETTAEFSPALNAE